MSRSSVQCGETDLDILGAIAAAGRAFEAMGGKIQAIP
jgi:hypothetical protein